MHRCGVQLHQLPWPRRRVRPGEMSFRFTFCLSSAVELHTKSFAIANILSLPLNHILTQHTNSLSHTQTDCLLQYDGRGAEQGAGLPGHAAGAAQDAHHPRVPYFPVSRLGRCL